MARMSSSTPSSRTALTSQVTYTFCTKPATMKPTKLTAATVTAYGSCVETWFRCSLELGIDLV